MASWQFEAVPQGAQPVPVVVPSLPLKSNLTDSQSAALVPINRCYSRFGQHDHARLTILQVRYKLADRAGIHRSCAATTGDALCKSLCGSRDADSRGQGSDAYDRRDESRELHDRAYHLANTDKSLLFGYLRGVTAGYICPAPH